MKITLFDLIFLRMPEPDAAQITMQQQLDMNRNPHGDHHKPPRRSRNEIIADARTQAALEQLNRLARFKEDHFEKINGLGGFSEVDILPTDF